MQPFGVLDRYIGKTIFTTIMMTLFMLVSLSGIIKFVDQLKKAGQGSYDALGAGMYTLLSVPKDVQIFFPMAALLGALLGLGMLAQRSELVVMQASGFTRMQVALSVMIPMLSALRLNVYNLPTALVSNTLDYGKFDILETTGYMRSTLGIWDELGFTFDAVATGFLVSEEQSLLVSDYCRACKERGVPVFVDPIMGDEGALYNGVTEASVEHMRHMCAVADIIMPNVTEAEYLTGMHVGKRVLSEGELLEVAQALHAMGARSVVVTSAVVEGPCAACGAEGSEGGVRHVTLVSEQRGADAEPHVTLLPYDEIPVRLPGTGDIFSSVLIGRYMNGRPLVESVQAAMDVVVDMLQLCKDNDDKYKGVPIEQYLDRVAL